VKRQIAWHFTQALYGEQLPGLKLAMRIAASKPSAGAMLLRCAVIHAVDHTSTCKKWHADTCSGEGV